MNPSTFFTSTGIGMYLETVLTSINTSGIRITPSTSPNGGSSLESSLISSTLTGNLVNTLFPMNRPHITPATIIHINAVGIPTIIITPRLTPSESATRTEPADGGTNAYPLASPARSGIA